MSNASAHARKDQRFGLAHRFRAATCLILAVVGMLANAGQSNSAIAQETQAASQSDSFSAMRSIRGKHILLKSDSGTNESLKDLVDSFDAAVPQWASFFGVPIERINDWTVDAFVMKDRRRFRDSGDLPLGLEFPFGYAIPGNIWAIEQPSDYYTRHLLLHEGVHALAVELNGGTGPSWFAEGIAEMLSVHSGSGSETRVNVVPRSREAVPFWGRFKLLSQRRSENKIPTIDSVLNYPPDLQSDVESYGWSWAAIMLLSEYPEYRGTLLDAAKESADRTRFFTNGMKRQLAAQMPIIRARWRLLCETLDYGFDWSGERVKLSMSDKLWDGSDLSLRIKASSGWQSAGVRFAPGVTLHLQASGQCVLDHDPKPWVSYPPGVTIEYARSRPLGQLMVAVVPNQTKERDFLKPLEVISVESSTKIQVDQHSWILLRINDHLGKRADNKGHYTVELSPSE